MHHALRLVSPVVWVAACAMSGSAAAAVTPEDWAKAEPIIRAALECKAKPNHTPAVKAVLATPPNEFGEIVLPVEMTVFGMKVKSISVYEGDEETGRSYSSVFKGVSLAEVGKAAKLNKEKGSPRWVKLRKDGSLMFEAGESRPGQINLNCSMDF